MTLRPSSIICLFSTWIKIRSHHWMRMESYCTVDVYIASSGLLPLLPPRHHPSVRLLALPPLLHFLPLVPVFSPRSGSSSMPTRSGDASAAPSPSPHSRSGRDNLLVEITYLFTGMQFFLRECCIPPGYACNKGDYQVFVFLQPLTVSSHIFGP